MNIAYFGTGDFSTNILKGLLESYKDINLKLIISQPDGYIGRKKILTPTPIKQFALEHGLETYQPISLRNNPSIVDKLKSLNLDFIVVVAYGQIIPLEILDIPKYGPINIHGSILPKYRGASPIQESIKYGDIKTGLTTMFMDEGMDTGDILKIEEINIDIVDKTPDIFNKFEKIGPNLLYTTLYDIVNNGLAGTPQDDSKATYCSKISRDDGYIIFKDLSSFEIYNKFRAYNPWPGIYTFYGDKKLEITDCFFDLNFDISKYDIGSIIDINNKISIVCKKGILYINRVKISGKKETNIKDFLNGNKGFLNYKFD